MIQRQKDGFAIGCDACGEADETYDVGSFQDAWNLFRRLGWTARKNGADWSHECPRCAQKPARGAREMFGETKRG